MAPLLSHNIIAICPPQVRMAALETAVLGLQGEMAVRKQQEQFAWGIVQNLGERWFEQAKEMKVEWPCMIV